MSTKKEPTPLLNPLLPIDGEFEFSVREKFRNLAYKGSQRFKVILGGYAEGDRLRITRMVRWKDYLLKDGKPPLNVTSNDPTSALEEAQLVQKDTYSTNVTMSVELNVETKVFLDAVHEKIVDAIWRAVQSGGVEVFPKQYPVKSREAVRMYVINEMYSLNEKTVKSYAEVHIPCALRFADSRDEKNLPSLLTLSEEDKARLVLQPVRSVCYYEKYGTPAAVKWDMFQYGTGAYEGCFFVKPVIVAASGSPAMKVRLELVSMLVHPSSTQLQSKKRTILDMLEEADDLFAEFNDALPLEKKMRLSQQD